MKKLVNLSVWIKEMCAVLIKSHHSHYTRSIGVWSSEGMFTDRPRGVHHIQANLTELPLNITSRLISCMALSIRALYYYNDLTTSESFQPMAARLSMKPALPLTKSFATASCRMSNTSQGPAPYLTEYAYNNRSRDVAFLTSISTYNSSG